VTPPSYRFDIAIEEDLVEELARIHGLRQRSRGARRSRRPRCCRRPKRARRAPARSVAERDYHEVVTYSFIDSRWEEDFCANAHPVALANPIASQMSVMRSSLIPGLVMSVAFNVRHKQSRVRLFEIGRVFRKAGDDYAQPVRVGGAAYGDALPDQWGGASRRVDFYDVKGDLEALFAPREPRFEAAEHPALHPGKSARIVVGTQVVGWIGELHPRWPAEVRPAARAGRLRGRIRRDRRAGRFRPTARSRRSRRCAATSPRSSTKRAPRGRLRALLARRPPIVTDVRLFDVYRGKDLQKGRKSLAFMVLLQDTRKTLTDAEVESAVSQLVRSSNGSTRSFADKGTLMTLTKAELADLPVRESRLQQARSEGHGRIVLRGSAHGARERQRRQALRLR
jgi:phenylalanyl-tRNA synthetase beta chain